VVQIFTATGVTDGARADLKKEMTKKNVRKGIVDGVLSQLLASSGQATDAQTLDLPSSGSNRPFLSSRQPTASTLNDALSSRTASLNSSVMGENLESKPSEGEEVASVYVCHIHED
jgi:CLIP-associating protein 1/2